MDFNNFEIKSIVKEDEILVFNKFDQMYYTMNIDSSSCTQEEEYFNSCKTLLTRYNYEYNPRDHVKLIPLEVSGETKCSDNSKYIALNHTTQNDLNFEYNMGFGKLVINDYRVKDYRIQRINLEQVSKGAAPASFDAVDGKNYLLDQDMSNDLSRNRLLRGGISSKSGTQTSRDL